MIGSGLNIDGVGSGLSKDGNCMYGSNNCFSIGLGSNNEELGSSSIQDGIQKYNINYIQAYGEWNTMSNWFKYYNIWSL